jgi:hypothetical protein
MDWWSYDIALLVLGRPEDPNEVVRVLETACTHRGPARLASTEKLVPEPLLHPPANFLSAAPKKT